MHVQKYARITYKGKNLKKVDHSVYYRARKKIIVKTIYT